MIRVQDALRAIIKTNPLLEFGLHHRLYNLTQLAHYLQPLVEARTHKAVSISALVMSLSRLQQALAANTPAPTQYVLEKITLISGLCTATYAQSPETHQRLNTLYHQIQQQNGFCNLAEGMREITVIVEGRHQESLHRLLGQTPLYTHTKLAAIGVQFGAHYADIPGMLYVLLQRVALQNVNLIEISSTYTEILFYVAERDTRVVFDTLFESFLVQDTNGR